MQSKDYPMLRNCPFCGNCALVMQLKQSVSPRYFVACGNRAERCIASAHWMFGDFYATKEEAAEAWNRRAENEAPAAEVTQVVRCSDCVCMGKRPPLPEGYREDCGWCMLHGRVVLPEDYCSNGERMDDDENAGRD